MACFLLTWSPIKTPWEELEEYVDDLNRNKFVKDRWSCGVTKKIEKGDRLFMLRQRVEPRGIFGSGWATSAPYEDDHWDAASHMPTALYVDVEFDRLLNPEHERILAREELSQGVLGNMYWDAQASGTTIPNDIARELEKKWSAFLGKRKKRIRKTRPKGEWGFTEPERNDEAERAAIEYVTERYRRDGWKVVSKEKEPVGYDLLCTRRGDVNHVEVKGLSGGLQVFEMTRKEVECADENLDFILCVVNNVLTKKHAQLRSYTGKDLRKLFSVTAIKYKVMPK